jgi:hypothetical protein
MTAEEALSALVGMMRTYKVAAANGAGELVEDVVFAHTVTTEGGVLAFYTVALLEGRTPMSTCVRAYAPGSWNDMREMQEVSKGVSH